MCWSLWIRTSATKKTCDSPVVLQSSGPPPATLSGLRFGPRENQTQGNRSRRQYELNPHCKLTSPERRPAASSTPKPACTTSAPGSSTLQVAMHRRRWERSLLAQIRAVFGLQLGHVVAAGARSGCDWLGTLYPCSRHDDAIVRDAGFFYTRGKVVARLALAEMDSRTPLFRERLWPHLEARPRCSFPQLAVERT